MARLLIGCELGKQSTADSVQLALESWGAVRLLQSLWLLSTKMDARYVNSALQDLVEPRDSVAVVDVHPGSEWSAFGVAETATAWLRDNIGDHP